MKKIVNKILVVLYILIIILATMITILAVSRNMQGIIEVFGYSPIIVTDSTLKPNMIENDLLIVKKQEKYQIGDIISYISVNGNKSVIKTDIIRNITLLEKTKQIFTMENTNENIDSSCIIGKEQTVISNMGKVLNYLLSRDGFLLIFVTPLLAIFIYLLLQFVNTFSVKAKKS